VKHGESRGIGWLEVTSLWINVHIIHLNVVVFFILVNHRGVAQVRGVSPYNSIHSAYIGRLWCY
jgi:hypothetical protein